MVQGSRQEFDGITSEQRTESPLGSLGCAGFAPDTAHTSAVSKTEQEWYRRGYFVPLSLIIRDKGTFFVSKVKLQFVRLLQSTFEHVILSGARSAESKNLRTIMTYAVK